MFWDNRMTGSVAEGFDTPAEEKLPTEGFDNILAVQAMFPVTSRDEMRGEIGDLDVNGDVNELALISNASPQTIWHRIMLRLLAIEEYRQLFKEAYPRLKQEELSFQHAANAIAAFEASEWTLLDSPFDLYLAGNNEAMSLEAKEGALLFYGKAGCSGCHSGSLLTDQKTHNIAIPPLGPGKSGSEIDFGVELLSKDKSDRCAFRTPPLRNVTLTGPWMHNGAYTSLEDVIWHHLDPEAALRIYDVGQLEPALRHTVKRETHIQETLLANLDVLLSSPKALTSNEIGQVLAFLEALTSPSAVDLAGSRPDFVPSGLPFD